MILCVFEALMVYFSMPLEGHTMSDTLNPLQGHANGINAS